MVYRGTESGMSGYQHAWEAGKLEGVKGAWQTQPTAYLGTDGKVGGVACVKLDDNKQPIGGLRQVRVWGPWRSGDPRELARGRDPARDPALRGLDAGVSRDIRGQRSAREFVAI
jgi:hypothetical protein